MKGAIYTQASFVIKKATGRTLFSRAPSTGSTPSIVALDFNLADDQIYMQAGGIIYLAPAGPTGDFTAINEQKEAGAADAALTAQIATQVINKARIGDAWVVANGSDFPVLIENNLRGRKLGLPTPRLGFTLADSSRITTVRPVNAVTSTVADSFFLNAGRTRIPFIELVDRTFAYDTSSFTACNFSTKKQSVRAGAPATSATPVGFAQLTFNFTSTTTAPNLFVSSDFSFDNDGQGRAFCRPTIEISTDSGATFVTVFEGVRGRNNRQVIQSNSSSTNPSRVQMRYTIDADNLKDHNDSAGQFLIFNITLDSGGSENTFSTQNLGFRYAYTYVKKYHRTLPGNFGATVEVESDPSFVVPDISVDPFTFTTTNGVTLAFSDDETPGITHRRIYRTTDVVTIEQSRTVDEFFRIGEIPLGDRTFFDRIGDTGFDVDFVGGVENLPFLVIGGLVRASNIPPPFGTNVVGSFGGSVLYSSELDDGIFYWSRPLPAGSPDYVPPDYSDIVPGAVTAFADIGVSLVFTPRSVHAYSFFPLASDAGFFPDRAKSPISNTHGCISKQGVAIFQAAEGQILAGFVAGDGVYITDGSRLIEISKSLDWKATVDVSSLPSAQLHNDPTNKKLLFVYVDNDGTTQKIDVNYEGPIKFSGPQRWPSNSGDVLIQNDGVVRIYSEQSGVVYLEENGVVDNANLEDALGTITWEIETNQIYPFQPGGKGQLEDIMVDIDKESNSEVEVTVFYRIDTGQEREANNKFFLKTEGWKHAVAVNKQCESFRVVMKSTSPNFPGLNAWTASTDQEDDIFATRVTET